jgi:transitional endoplasmic reticulum ATPase
MAATNYLDRLDPAAIREGRFDFKIEITPPDQEARVGLLKSGLTKYASKVSVSEEVIQSVAKRWNGYSVKRILAVTEEMPSYLEDMTEKGQRRTALDFDDFMAALRRIQGSKGAQPEDVKPMSEMILPPATLDAVNMIAGRLRDPQRTEALGGSLPTGVLFYGPPGTGKTAVCKALAKEVGYAFLVSTGSDLARDPKAVEKLYAQGKELRPAIIFIDEADDLVRSREYSASTEATNKLLTVMDGIKDRVKDVIWVAATNHIDQVDSALLRGGRFTEKVPFFKPEEHQIEKHVGGWLDKRKLVLESDLTVREISLAIGEQSIANVEAVLQYAVNRAIGRAHGDQVVLKREDVRAALSVVLQTAG